MYLIEINKTNIGMSIAEALAILKPKKYTIIDDYLIIEKKSINYKNLSFGLVKNIYEIINSADNIEDLKINASKIQFEKLISKTYKVDTENCKEEKDKIIQSFAGIIKNNLKLKNIEKPVSIDNPKTLFVCIKTKNKYFFTQKVWSNNDDFKARELKQLPQRLPTATNPKIAKAMVNLTGKKKARILDPFCGSGGILIEAAFLGHKISGFDIDKRALGSAKLNMLHLGINNFTLELKDCLTVNLKADAIVTDVPYGRNSKINQDLKKLYKEFLHYSSKSTKTLIIGFPSEIDESFITKEWKIDNFFEIYIHKSMSKKIFVLKR